MYDQFKCYFCGYPVDPKNESTAELVTAWVVKARVIQACERTWRYAHKVCVETEWAKQDDSGDQSTLF